MDYTILGGLLLMDNAEMFRMIHQAITESNEDLTSKIDDVRTEMTAKFEEVYTRFDKLDVDMDYLKSKFQEHDRDIFM
jgi:flagellar capping protein FliD